MQPIKHALVLTGEILPGFDAATVWPALAAYFRMEPDRLKAELLARAPISIKESDDLAKLQKLQDGASAVGAMTDLQAISGDNLFVLVDGVPRGPVPHAYVEDRVRSGAWPSSISIAVVGSSDWKPFIVPSSPATDMDQQATVAFNTIRAENTAPSAAKPSAPAVDMRMAAAAPAAAAFASSVAAGDLLPEGGIVHAGFWRRCAAYVLDSIILSIAFLIIMGLVGLATAALIAGEHFGMVGLIMFVAYVGLIVSAWLYFAKLESGPSQATIGKRVMGIKVTDDRGQRIGFGRATGRFFGKIISGMIMNIGYLMAGFTGRKQALHDMMAGCCVVFREVEPGRPLPTVRPPMPWYGWALNILMFAGIVGGIAVYAYLISTMIGLGSRFPGSSMSSDPAPSFPTSSSTQDSDSSTSSSNDTSSSSSGVDEGDKATIRAGLTAVFMVASATQSEVATIADGGGDCPTEERSSDNAWIESIQLGGISPQCTVTIRLSSSSDIPFAARIERIEWSYAGSGNWRCESSMASDLLPFTCN